MAREALDNLCPSRTRRGSAASAGCTRLRHPSTTALALIGEKPVVFVSAGAILPGPLKDTFPHDEPIFP